MLKGSLINSGNRVDRAVVGGHAVEKGKVQTRQARGFECGQIGIILKHSVNGARERVPKRMRRRRGELAYEAAVVAARLEHNRRAAIPARFEVQGDADLASPGMFFNEGASAQQAGLFTVTQQNDDVVLQRRARRYCSERFENRGYRRAVIRRAGSGCYGVVMRGKQHGLAVVGAIQPAENIVHRRSDKRTFPGLRYDRRFLHLSLNAERLQLAHEVFSNFGVLRRADRMRFSGDILKICYRASGREFGGRHIGGRRGRRTVKVKAKNYKKGQHKKRKAAREVGNKTNSGNLRYVGSYGL